MGMMSRTVELGVRRAHETSPDSERDSVRRVHKFTILNEVDIVISAIYRHIYTFG